MIVSLRLNPCFNGILKYAYFRHTTWKENGSLNPCFNGILKYLKQQVKIMTL